MINTKSQWSLQRSSSWATTLYLTPPRDTQSNPTNSTTVRHPLIAFLLILSLSPINLILFGGKEDLLTRSWEQRHTTGCQARPQLESFCSGGEVEVGAGVLPHSTQFLAKWTELQSCSAWWGHPRVTCNARESDVAKVPPTRAAWHIEHKPLPPPWLWMRRNKTLGSHLWVTCNAKGNPMWLKSHRPPTTTVTSDKTK